MTKKRSAFTLIELMIVVIIVSILATSAVPLYRSALSRAYEVEIVSSLGVIRTAQRIHFVEKGVYSQDISNVISEDDFKDMRFVNYDSFSVHVTEDEKFYIVWEGVIEGYNHKAVSIDMSGNIRRGESAVDVIE